MAVKIITPPNEEPITLDDVRSYLHGIDYDDQDDDIQSFIQSARIKIENRCGRSIMKQTLEQSFPSFDGILRLDVPPVTDVVAVKYTDTAGVEQTISNTDYDFIEDEYGFYVYPLSSWPVDVTARPNAVRVQYVSGHEAKDVPEDLKQAVRLLVGTAFELRQDVLLTPVRQELQITPNSYEDLIAPYIVMRM